MKTWLIEALQRSLERVESGEPPEDALPEAPGERRLLGPLLRVAQGVRKAPAPRPSDAFRARLEREILSWDAPPADRRRRMPAAFRWGGAALAAALMLVLLANGVSADTLLGGLLAPVRRASQQVELWIQGDEAPRGEPAEQGGDLAPGPEAVASTESGPPGQASPEATRVRRGGSVKAALLLAPASPRAARAGALRDAAPAASPTPPALVPVQEAAQVLVATSPTPDSPTASPSAQEGPGGASSGPTREPEDDPTVPSPTRTPPPSATATMPPIASPSATATDAPPSPPVPTVMTPPPAPAPGEGVIAGVVRLPGDEPQADAQVELHPVSVLPLLPAPGADVGAALADRPSQQALRSAITGPDGRYRFEGLEDGEYVLLAVHEDRATGRVRLGFRGDEGDALVLREGRRVAEDVDLWLALEIGPPSPPQGACAARGGSIQGRVTREDGTPVQDAAVWPIGPGPVGPPVITDASGDYRALDLCLEIYWGIWAGGEPGIGVYDPDGDGEPDPVPLSPAAPAAVGIDIVLRPDAGLQAPFPLLP